MSSKLNTLSDVDFEKSDELMRDQTPADIQQKVAQLCSTFLSGVWSHVEPEELLVRRIPGGLSNQLYHCRLPEQLEPDEDRPREVVVRLYWPKWIDHFDLPKGSERSVDAIIATVVSERRIGPKCYGVGPVGEVLEYIESRPFFAAEENDPEMVAKLAKKLAQIHYMDVPIDKTNNYFKTIRRFLSQANRQELKNQFDFQSIADEINFIESCVNQLNPPVVFNHNDFRNVNILVRPDNQITMCDFEFAAYSYRSLDFAWLFYFWGNSKVEIKFVEDQVLHRFFKPYIEECARIKGPSFFSDPKNSVDHLVKETKVFYLSSLLFVALLFLHVDDVFAASFQNVVSVDMFRNTGAENIKKYFEYKQKFVVEKII